MIRLGGEDGAEVIDGPAILAQAHQGGTPVTTDCYVAGLARDDGAVVADGLLVPFPADVGDPPRGPGLGVAEVEGERAVEVRKRLAVPAQAAERHAP